LLEADVVARKNDGGRGRAGYLYPLLWKYKIKTSVLNVFIFQ